MDTALSLPDPRSVDSRRKLAAVIMRLFDRWGLASEEQLVLLGLEKSSRATLTRYRRGEPVSANRDMLDRIGHLLAIHKSLRLLFPENREMAYAWMRSRNRAFDRRTPVEVAGEFGFAGLLMVRAYLDRRRGQ
ncbi:MAG TPA: MbcA/ParS/Xre antitoxin family protein [Gammaproteobacteria bacterium]|nr:MbcA/ParS/Xre antitoxin family protein [Gammaproteobacteria bacterium]